MGGHGSGRRPDVMKQLLSQPEVKSPVGEGMFLPNYSGVKPEALKTSSTSITSSTDATARVSAIAFIIDGGGSAITTGIKGDIEIPFDCTINRATALLDQSGSIVVDIWKDTYANYPPTDADSITASAPVTVSSATKSQDSTLTGWTTSITAGDTLRFNVDSITTTERCTIVLKVTKT